MADANGVKAGQAYVEVGTAESPFYKGIKAVEARLQKFGSFAASIGSKLFVGGAAGLAPLLGAVKSFADAGSELADMSARTGTSVESLSEMKYAFKQSGVEAEGLEASLKKMNKTLGAASNGDKGATESLRELGLSMDDLKGKSPDQQMQIIMDRIGKIGDIGKRTAAIMEVFGKSGVDLLPLVGNLAELRKQAQELGLTMSTADANAADALGDALDGLSAGAQSLVNKIGSALAPTLTMLANSLLALAKPVGEWIANNSGLITTIAAVAAGVTVLGIGLIGLGAASTAAAAGLSALVAIVGALLSPIGLTVAAVVGLGSVILTQTEVGRHALKYLSDQFGSLVAFVQAAMQGVSDAMAAGRIDLAAKIIWATLNVAWQTGAASLVNYTMRGMASVADAVMDAGVILKRIWSDLFVYLSATFDLFSTAILSGWKKLTNATASFFVPMMAKLSGQSVEDVQAALDEMGQQEQKDLASGAEQRMKQRQAELDKNLKSQIDGHAEIDKLRKSGEGMDFATSLGLNPAGASAELSKLLAEAAAARANVAKPDQVKKGQEATEEAAVSAKAVTTKNAAAAQFGSSQAASSIARAASSGMDKEQKKQTEELKKVKAGIAKLYDGIKKLISKPVIKVNEVS